MNIITLGEGNNVKGKAGKLNDLFHHFPIVKGFILPNQVFLDFINWNHISLDDPCIIQKIIDGSFKDELELKRYFKENQYETVIVRSSASIEDGNNYSFAGQFQSYTNTNKDNLILNIKRCWASRFEPHIKEYLALKKDTISFDVLIQEMVKTDISGIAFSINPINGLEEFLIELTDAQCEALASGEVIPRTYHIKDHHVNNDPHLFTICETLKSLKHSLKQEVEIEFGFRNNQFYLFQVRPITSIHFSLHEYINRECWCCFKNNHWTLFTRSLWILGATRYKHKKIYNRITEDITVYFPHGQTQIRGFNGNQPPLDDKTLKEHNSDDINTYIEESYQLAEHVIQISSLIHEDIQNDDFDCFFVHLKQLIKENAMIQSYEYLIGSLGNALLHSLDPKTIRNIECWRNDQNNSYFPIYNEIFSYAHSHFHLDVDRNLFWMFTHVCELIQLCGQKLSPKTLINRILKRDQFGFVLFNLHHKKYHNRVIVNPKTIMTVKQKFAQMKEELLPINGVKGQSTFKNGKTIIGECIVVNSGMNLATLDLQNKILVCEVTTAKDIGYLKKVKALIVDYGGVLCHSAIFSREFRIPCLMGCEIASTYFQSGDVISYDVDSEIATKVI